MDHTLSNTLDLVEVDLAVHEFGEITHALRKLKQEYKYKYWRDDPDITPQEYDPNLIWDEVSKDWIHQSDKRNKSDDEILVEDFLKELNDEYNKENSVADSTLDSDLDLEARIDEDKDRQIE